MSKRNRLLRSKPPPNVLAQFLPESSNKSAIYNETVDILALKARQHDGVKKERERRVFKKECNSSEKSSRMITSFCSSIYRCRAQKSMTSMMPQPLYQELYTPTTIDDHALECLACFPALFHVIIQLAE
ncbi:hypothetical protein O0I10_009119 [Lichtheimia ornata]|uniref:Uncharacterized protein n=1 Tax=Lichtheimia ornata TaxID=688661 RepID=A0AAD7XWD5_9FUNG|nr:uncharacterized protein O0I10_009119 [Lichtheimia ornata]KAJ8655251.1 hypothetical protein O0I10_009119 [Lichtheimia ornata]